VVGQLLGAEGLKHTVDSKALLHLNSDRLAEQLRVLDARVQEHILLRRGSSGARRSASNILRLKNKILGRSLRAPDLADELRLRSGNLKYDGLDPVCVIYAGGTIGMIHQKKSDRLHADFEMAVAVESIVDYVRPRLLNLHFNMHFFSLEHPIDSSNVTALDWVNLASLLAEQMGSYQGFVILHGTNTLAYTASALSFLLQDSIRKPVVMTGAEVPLSVEDTDAAHNIENAIRAAAWHQPAVPMVPYRPVRRGNATSPRRRRGARKKPTHAGRRYPGPPKIHLVRLA
jgi:Asparaginase, N-terminal